MIWIDRGRHQRCSMPPGSRGPARRLNPFTYTARPYTPRLSAVPFAIRICGIDRRMAASGDSNRKEL